MSFIDSADRIVDWFIPARLLAEREMRTRARMFLISHLFGPILGNVIPGYLFWLEPHPGATLLILALSITGFWVFPFLLKFTGRYVLLSYLSVQNLLFAILWGCYFYGGASSPFLPWLVTVPLLAFFYLGASVRNCFILLLQICVSLGSFSEFYLLGGSFPTTIPLSQMQGIGVISIISASIYVAMMALFYTKILASQTEVEAELNKHLETSAQLRAAALQAERAGVAKAAFLNSMSHELRTPLNAVIGYSEMLIEDTDPVADPTSLEDLGRIRAAGRNLLSLVNAILDLSKIEAGKMEIFREPVDMANLAAQLEAHWNRSDNNGGNRVSARLVGERRYAETDPAKLERIVNELIENAVRCTKDGAIEIVIDTSRSQGDDGEGWLSIDVRDTGVGIAAESIPKLFEVFVNREDATASNYGSAGLGLPLCDRFCRLLGGALTVVSELGKGSTFTIRLPQGRATHSEAADNVLAEAA
ncbi:HAMP domain-containing sensor histidine kinase [Methylocapsa sp. S129]|uniref:sensor histidine kinase n=1 Tax=Methylocapsa sp. S129 TaxID=1641869 RepID=UPI00131CBA0D|nr:HAMP domain-containing sensor histidine kinase [Methylocapsa sp. S129]